MSRHFTTQENHKRAVMDRVNEVFWWVHHGKLAHKHMLNNLNERVYTTNSWKRLTQINQSYMRGVIDTKIDEIWRNHIDWRVYHKDHGHVKREDNDVLDGIWSEVDGDMGAHFWKGTDKLWTGSPDVFAMYKQDPWGSVVRVAAQA